MRAVRFELAVLERLRRYARARPGLGTSALTSRFVDEALRMEEPPGVLFRDGPSGRRAVLIGGPDVWEVVRVALGYWAAYPDEIEQQIRDADDAQRVTEERWQRERRLLS